MIDITAVSFLTLHDAIVEHRRSTWSEQPTGTAGCTGDGFTVAPRNRNR